MPHGSPDIVLALQSSLSDVFFQAVRAFNNQDLPDLAELLDDNVVLNKIDHPFDPVHPKSKVLNYLETKVMRDKPQFAPFGPITINTATQQISGQAIWEDFDSEVRTSRPISYQFGFTLHSDQKWYLNYLYGTSD
jgi:hypothetical protein